VLPLRNPIELAKQVASLDVLSGGRMTLGVGAGWLREEFEALGVPFARRGRRLVEWIEIARDCWSGRPRGRASEDYTVPDGLVVEPTPLHEVAVLIGGHGPRALRRAGTLGDGWLGQQTAGEVDVAELEAAVDGMRTAASAAGRDPALLRVVLRLVQSAGRFEAVACDLPALARAGVDEIVVDVDWAAGDLAPQHAVLREAAAAV
jgi:probable F420-dependent oxidoreductase